MLLFVIRIPLGVMNLVAMGIVTAVVFGEMTPPGGRRFAKLAGIGVVAYGLLVLFAPAALPA